MRVFVTGATGSVGLVVVQELLEAGHQVLGLARSGAAGRALRAAGADVLWGSLEDRDSLRKGAEAADGVIHTAFQLSSTSQSVAINRAAVKSLGAALAGSDRPLVITSAIAASARVALLPGQVISEDDRPPAGGAHPHAASEAAANSVAAWGVRISVIRLPWVVHGAGNVGPISALITLARATGVAAYPDHGDNYWPAVHRRDAARLYRLALEQVSAPGTRFHAVAEAGICLRELAEIIGRRLRLPVQSLSVEAAVAHFGRLAYFTALNLRATSQFTQQHLGWQPEHPGLLTDLDQKSYFE